MCHALALLSLPACQERGQFAGAAPTRCKAGEAQGATAPWGEHLSLPPTPITISHSSAWEADKTTKRARQGWRC